MARVIIEAVVARASERARAPISDAAPINRVSAQLRVFRREQVRDFEGEINEPLIRRLINLDRA